jgi:hypothetical protein
MPERREKPRIPVGERRVLVIEGRQVHAAVENLSEIGGLFLYHGARRGSG